jgi:hypothetical protein
VSSLSLFLPLTPSLQSAVCNINWGAWSSLCSLLVRAEGEVVEEEGEEEKDEEEGEEQGKKLIVGS